MRKFKCPICGKFVSDVQAIVSGLGDIIRVIGKCEKHKIVDVSNTADWCYEDFFGWPD